MTTKLKVVLEDLRVASPCSADWDEMAGDDRVRFCGKCEKNVYNLSSMNRAEAEALVAAREGRLCVRFYQRRDGTVLTGDCPVGAERKRLRARIWASVSGVAASAALLLGLAGGRARADLTIRDGKTPTTQPQPPRLGHVNVVQGGPVAHPPPPPLMGTVAMTGEVAQPPEVPKKPTAKMGKVSMGEPMPIMGDIAAPPTK